jgi:hypothetical protein
MVILQTADLESRMEFKLAATALDIGRNIRVRINSMPIPERAKSSTSILKPDAKDRAKFADSEAERLGIEALEGLSKELKHDIHLIVDPSSKKVYRIGKNSGSEVVFAYLDAVDGTIKVAGLGNDPSTKTYRLASDGAWATGLAFSLPTKKTVDRLVIKDFQVAAIIDGNPPMYRSFPSEVIAMPYHGNLTTFEPVNKTLEQLSTSSAANLSQSMVYLDSFQAFDRQTRKPLDEQIAKELYAKLIDRNSGGAFDILRQYGNLNSLIRNMLGWKNADYNHEPQCVAFICINENLPNMIPSVPVILGAGGNAHDFAGNELADRKLSEGRTSILYAANDGIAMNILIKIHR